MTFGRQPRFVRRYADVGKVMTDAIKSWTSDVKSGAYPNDQESYGLTDETKKEMAAG
jgi:3-methyl-2-oxobutanoate hydroxymethyltransferase